MSNLHNQGFVIHSATHFPCLSFKAQSCFIQCRQRWATLF